MKKNIFAQIVVVRFISCDVRLKLQSVVIANSRIKVQKLSDLGFRFHRYGGDYPPLPERLREVDRFVEQYPEHELQIAEPDRSLLPDEQ